MIGTSTKYTPRRVHGQRRARLAGAIRLHGPVRAHQAAQPGPGPSGCTARSGSIRLHSPVPPCGGFPSLLADPPKVVTG